MVDTKTTAIAKTDYDTQVIKRVDQLCQVGFTMPKDYNYINALKASMLILPDIKDRNNRPALEVCTPASIQKALFKMATKGLDASKKQCYFIVRGNQLCCDDSYFGKVAQVKRIFPDWEPYPRVLYEGDEFAFTTDLKTGKRVLAKHEQSLSNLDGDFIGAYLYLPCKDGSQELYVMTKKEIIQAWMKSANSSQTTHKQFPTKMIGKTIVNSGCNMIINSTPELQDSQFAEPVNNDEPEENDVIDSHYEEITEINPAEIPVEEVKVQEEVKEEKKEEEQMDF